MIAWAILLVYSICGVLAYGITYGHFQNKWPRLAALERTSDRFLAIVVGLIGPIGLLVALMQSNMGRYGMKWR